MASRAASIWEAVVVPPPRLPPACPVPPPPPPPPEVPPVSDVMKVQLVLFPESAQLLVQEIVVAFVLLLSFTSTELIVLVPEGLIFHCVPVREERRDSRAPAAPWSVRTFV